MEIHEVLNYIEEHFTNGYISGIADMENKKRRIISFINKEYPRNKNKIFQKGINQTPFSDQFVWDYIRHIDDYFRDRLNELGPSVVRKVWDYYDYYPNHHMLFGLKKRYGLELLRRK